MNNVRKTIALFLCTLVLAAGVACTPVCAESLTFNDFRKQLEWVEHAFVGHAITEAELIRGARDGLLSFITHNPALKSKPHFRRSVYFVTDMRGLEKAYEECTQTLSASDSHAAMYALLDGMVRSLHDKYSVFMTPKNSLAFFSLFQDKKYVGIGILWIKRLGYPEINKVLEDAPAARAGLRAKDIIIAVDGKSMYRKDEHIITQALLGVEGSVVHVTVRRHNGVHTFVITRAHVQWKSVACYVADHVAHIEVRFFGEETNSEIDALMTHLSMLPLKGYVLDLRDNPGGYVGAAVHMVSKFVPGGSVVLFSKNRAGYYFTVTDGSYVETARPLVVLINKDSASAAEITAGALKDYGHTVIGETSYGKGCIQQPSFMRDGSVVKLTVALWKTPKYHPINQVGIKPDIEVKNDDNTDVDTQLIRAIQEVLKQAVR
ncbi:MAG: S41 family peptidase [Patescibacteria group bacterium]|nr:S41 family peptidase [Patescibacteria group bacterium]MDE2438575.1 S41 family peptidase [Patescibacteria group bacterium]